MYTQTEWIFWTLKLAGMTQIYIFYLGSKNKDADQTAWMCKLIYVLPFVKA